MRHVFIIFLICAAGSATALAEPTSRSHALGKRTAAVRPSNYATRLRDHHGSGGGLGGIHPLVGSGDY
jgi:hypothetical protein